MKKTLFILTLFVLMSFRGFAAWQDYAVWNVHAFRDNGEGQVENNTLYANINSYCDYIILSGYLNNHHDGGYLDMQVYGNSSQILSDYYDSAVSFNKRIDDPYGPPAYWNALTVYSEAYNTDAQLLLRWGQG